ncbi:imidazoleglycerol-phosphate dehydratase HisB [Ilyobacter polytropus]|uniref:Imidazoleglycerol-phosphate dehydratase n=1 Tax=Ilyobacter polytropus (strain ATCC 51220 / DSM 2926 / LMG 16218 / CuHBu1) TaxID=572544 RepID=E3HCR3_ILYPC|nr:imidazoleglycerol-phosphate dehydratase HisB [Ilyobacter polytropus]ADO84458.1 imidazoleglycerol-phosphate dehydratase [Ilyobacter polytropus DSM 2926]
MRTGQVMRNTKETNIELELNLDGTGKYDISTGVGFFDHMMELFTRHGLFDIKLKVKGDTYIDCHHSVEDAGIALGKAFKDALGDMKGIKRYGSFYLPMDETLTLSAVDISGRSYLYMDPIPDKRVGDMESEMVKEFFWGFVRNAGITLHIKLIHGENTHHIIESIFKGVARALDQAVTIDSRTIGEIPSTKGVI